MGDGETGERSGAIATGEGRLSCSEGRLLVDWAAVEMLRESLGLTAREASMLADVWCALLCLWVWYVLVVVVGADCLAVAASLMAARCGMQGGV